MFRATIGKPVVKQPLTWNVVLARGDLAPPLVDARDAFRKRFQGPGRSEFMEKHRNRMMRTFLFFGDTEKGGHFKASDEKALVRTAQQNGCPVVLQTIRRPRRCCIFFCPGQFHFSSHTACRRRPAPTGVPGRRHSKFQRGAQDVRPAGAFENHP